MATRRKPACKGSITIHAYREAVLIHGPVRVVVRILRAAGVERTWDNNRRALTFNRDLVDIVVNAFAEAGWPVDLRGLA
jgi:hypothetical protein